MRRIVLALFGVALWVAPAAAVQEADFRIATAEDVIDVCSTPSTDPLYTAAANFCQGYVVGAYQSYEAAIAKGKRKPFICLPSPVNRNEGIAQLVAWGKEHPEYKDEHPINFLFKFLREKWPCPSESSRAGTK
jgi:hypothetical protein